MCYQGSEQSSGDLVFMREEDDGNWQDRDAPGIVVHISGDTLWCIIWHMRGIKSDRPMPLHILADIFEQTALDDPNAQVLKIGIVDVQGAPHGSSHFFCDRYQLQGQAWHPSSHFNTSSSDAPCHADQAV